MRMGCEGLSAASLALTRCPVNAGENVQAQDNDGHGV